MPAGGFLHKLLLRLPPETAHNLALAAIRRGLVRIALREADGLGQTLFGTHFPNPLGLAAGFDKNGVATNRWSGLGFGFAEIGTITRLSQPGNPKPRLFRLPREAALINRMGFNNEGADAVADRLARAGSARIPLGINLGKSKATALEEAVSDYAYSFGRLAPHADYVVVNVSSPNTPGLRSLQSREALSEIVLGLKTSGPDKPLFVKVAPDLSLGELDDVVEVVHEAGATGLIATNTSTDRSMLESDPGIEGGLSGRPIAELATLTLEYLAQSCDRGVVLIGVGGLFTGDDLFRRIAKGAHLCQIYTGWVYRGPGAIVAILAELAEAMRRDGIPSLERLRGSALSPP